MAEDGKRPKGKLEKSKRLVVAAAGARLVEVDENSEKELETAGWKGSVELLTPLRFPMRGPQWVTGGYQLDRSETTTTGGCPAISGATPILSVLSAPGWPSCLF